MKERIKENGFNVASIAVVCSNLALFLIIAFKGTSKIWEPNPIILFTEIALCVGLISWGVERLVKDLRGERDGRQNRRSFV